jgi:uncharacterized membrane protein (DUF2068 family)
LGFERRQGNIQACPEQTSDLKHNPNRMTGVRIIIILYCIDAAISLVQLAKGTQLILVNGIGLAADLVAIAGLWPLKKWGAAFTIIASGKGMGQSILTLQLTYLNIHKQDLSSYYSLNGVWLPFLTIGTDIFIVVYLFRGIFRGQFE